MKTTLNKIKEKRPCLIGWKKLLKYLNKTKADDEELDFKDILNSNGIRDAVWCLRTQEYIEYCLFLADVAESCLQIYENKFKGDDRPKKAIKDIKKYHKKAISLEKIKNNPTTKINKDYAKANKHDNAAAKSAYAAAKNAANPDRTASNVIYNAIKAAANTDNADYYNAYNNKLDEIEQLFINHFINK